MLYFYMFLLTYINSKIYYVPILFLKNIFIKKNVYIYITYYVIVLSNIDTNS